MKTIVMTESTDTIHKTIYVTVAKRWIHIKGEQALFEDGEWDEYPIVELANAQVGSLIYRMSDEEAIKAIIERKIFDEKILEMLRSFKLGFGY